MTAENYVDLMTAYIRAHDNEGFVIRTAEGDKGSIVTKLPATEAEWFAWVRYFRTHNLPIDFVIRRGEATVPSRWPEEFDLTAETSDKLYAPMAPARGQGRDYSADVNRLFKQLASGVGEQFRAGPRARLPHADDDFPIE